MRVFREIINAFDNGAMKLIYTLGYLLVPGPKPPEHQLGWKDFNPLRTVALLLMGILVLTIFTVSFLIAAVHFLISPPSQITH